MLTLANVWGWILAHKRLVGIIVSCIAGLLLLFYLFTQVESCRFRSNIEKRKEAVNTKVQEIANIQTQIADLKIQEAEKAVEVKYLANSYLDSVNATNAVRAETNQALENMNSAIASNRNIGVTAADLEKRMNEIK